MEIQDNIQWHPAFCSAVELELREYKKYLTYEREHNLGKMPLKIDLLIIKKKPDIVIRNDIADFFLGNKELCRNNMCSLRRIFLRGCMSKNVGVAGYGEAF